MEKNVKLIYNPYARAAALVVDGTPLLRGKGRFEDMIVGRPMEDWLECRTVSYKRWRGLLLELMEMLNDDALEISFSGTEADYKRLQEALEDQRAAVTEAGYADDGWSLQLFDSQYYSPEAVRNALKGIRAGAVVVPPTQELLLDMKALDAQLIHGAGLDPAQLRELMDGYVRTMRACMEKCQEKHKNSWNYALRKIENYLK